MAPAPASGKRKVVASLFTKSDFLLSFSCPQIFATFALHGVTYCKFIAALRCELAYDAVSTCFVLQELG
jgi:hypothetical protein